MRYQVITSPKAEPGNPSVHMVVEQTTGRCLGGYGANYYRPWVFPLYTPSGLTVIQEFAYDHPFHNGVFVGQHPVQIGNRTANYWATPPQRGPNDHIAVNIGRIETQPVPEIMPHESGVRFRCRNRWVDEYGDPVLDEIRTVDLYAVAGATVCDMTSEKIAAYGDLHFPQTKFGSIGIRVEPRLLPPFGGTVIGDNDRRGKAEMVTETDSDFVAYENILPGGQPYGVYLSLPYANKRGPWFIRDYGMAMHNPTWVTDIERSQGQTWSVSLRVVAYDGALRATQARQWHALPLHL